MKNIFLSASIPVEERHRQYIETCDITSIRDAVIALSSLVIKDFRLIWGGHPAITPIISNVLKTFGSKVSEHVLLYQSKWFEDKFPPENSNFPAIYLTEKKRTLEDSLLEMRTRMISQNNFSAAFFIGGMEGVEKEYDMFKHSHPDTPIFPVASTGAAAKIIFERDRKDFSSELEDNLAYMSLFRRLLNDLND